MTQEQLCLRKNIDAQINKRKDEIEKNLIEIQRLAVPVLYDVGDVLTDAADITTMDGVEMNRVISVYQNDERMTIALSNVWAISQSLKALELRKKCHALFDKTWKDNKERSARYAELAKKLDIEECHFSWMSKEELKKALSLIKASKEERE